MCIRYADDMVLIDRYGDRAAAGFSTSATSGLSAAASAASAKGNTAECWNRWWYVTPCVERFKAEIEVR